MSTSFANMLGLRQGCIMRIYRFNPDLCYADDLVVLRKVKSL